MTFRGFLKTLSYILGIFVTVLILSGISYIIVDGINKKSNEEFNKVDLKNELDDLIDAGLSLSAASKYLAKKKNLTKSIIYNLH